MKYEPIIGMEVHVELSTKSKVFCGCSTNFHAPANTNVCPVCLGMPGVLPVINKRAVEMSVMVGLALNCTISRWSKMDRKNYFYPDLAKNYQISQYDLPLCHGGFIDIKANGATKRIGITRAHLEEDTARNTHTIGGGDSGVDFNRCGVTLLEIVTEPDIHSADEAFAYLTELKQLLRYLDVSDCNMEEGSLRAEANISIRPAGTTAFGTKTEVKNVASFSGIQKAIEFEIARQAKLLDEGGKVVQETRGWDADRGITFSQRAKESAHDYRYFPDPDLVPIVVDETWKEHIRATLPELPQARRQRFATLPPIQGNLNVTLDDVTSRATGTVGAYGLSEYDAAVITADKAMADYYEAVVKQGCAPKQAANWISVELQALLTEHKQELTACKVTADRLAAMLKLIDDGTISGKIAKDVLLETFETGKDPKSIVEEKGLVQISDTSAIEAAAREVIAANPGPVAEFRGGKERTFGFLVGQLMKATKGKANPQLANEVLRRVLKEAE